MSAPAASRQPAPQGERILVGAALILSLALVWFVTRNALVTAGFAAGLMALGGIGWLLARPRAVASEAEQALPDWSVTVAAIDRPDCAVAIIDRAGRLVCANPRYESWFGANCAPPRLPVDPPSLDRLAKAARAAWRDGRALADVVESASGRWQAVATRAGRGDDYLVWSIVPLTDPDPVASLVPHLDGKLGRALAQAGMALAVVDPDGTIRAHSAGFAQRAVGDGAALLTGQPFVPLLQQDERERISWARDGKRGGPLTMFYLPIADPDLANPDYANAPSLMLLVDAGVGLGGGVGGEGGASVPHLEALLGQLPLVRLGLPCGGQNAYAEAGSAKWITADFAGRPWGRTTISTWHPRRVSMDRSRSTDTLRNCPRRMRDISGWVEPATLAAAVCVILSACMASATRVTSCAFRRWVSGSAKPRSAKTLPLPSSMERLSWSLMLCLAELRSAGGVPRLPSIGFGSSLYRSVALLCPAWIFSGRRAGRILPP